MIYPGSGVDADYALRVLVDALDQHPRDRLCGRPPALQGVQLTTRLSVEVYVRPLMCGRLTAGPDGCYADRFPTTEHDCLSPPGPTGCTDPFCFLRPITILLSLDLARYLQWL